jgi:hypothetical protein
MRPRKFKVGDVVLVNRHVGFDLLPNTLAIVFKADDDINAYFAIRPMLYAGKYNKTGYWMLDEYCEFVTHIDEETA